MQVESPKLGDCQNKTAMLRSPDPFSSQPNTKEENQSGCTRLTVLTKYLCYNYDSDGTYAENADIPVTPPVCSAPCCTDESQQPYCP